MAPGPLHENFARGENGTPNLGLVAASRQTSIGPTAPATRVDRKVRGRRHPSCEVPRGPDACGLGVGRRARRAAGRERDMAAAKPGSAPQGRAQGPGCEVYSRERGSPPSPGRARRAITEPSEIVLVDEIRNRAEEMIVDAISVEVIGSTYGETISSGCLHQVTLTQRA